MNNGPEDRHRVAPAPRKSPRWSSTSSSSWSRAAGSAAARPIARRHDAGTPAAAATRAAAPRSTCWSDARRCSTSARPSRVSLTVPDVADAMVTAPTQLLIHGKTPGTISLFVWDAPAASRRFEVKVRRDLSALIAQLKQLFPGETSP